MTALHSAGRCAQPAWERCNSEVNVGSNGVVVRRTDRLIRRNNPDYLKVGIQVAGRSTVHQDDRKSELGTGDLAIYDTSRPYELRFAEAYRLLVVMFPKQLLGLPSGRLGYLTARGVNGRYGLGASVSPFLLQVGRRILRGDHSDNAQLAEAIVDLVGALFVDHFPPDAAHPDAARRAQLARVRAYIERNLGNPRMKVSDIAAANRMSIRYLQKLFEERGETVTDWIRTKRLQQCARDSQTPATDICRSARWPPTGVWSTPRTSLVSSRPPMALPRRHTAPGDTFRRPCAGGKAAFR